MEEALKQLCSNVEEAVRGGLEIVVLSDRIGTEDMDIETPPIPTLLAVGAVHHHLIRCASTPFRPQLPFASAPDTPHSHQIRSLAVCQELLIYAFSREEAHVDSL